MTCSSEHGYRALGGQGRRRRAGARMDEAAPRPDQVRVLSALVRFAEQADLGGGRERCWYRRGRDVPSVGSICLPPPLDLQ